jgi:hypothetical protein
LYFTTYGTWNFRRQENGGGWSAGFFNAQAESMLVHARLDVAEEDLRAECFERDSKCYGYFGVTPSLVRIPFLGILRFFHSALTPIFLAAAVLLAFWASMQIVQRSIRDFADRSVSHAAMLGYAALAALSLGPGGTLLFLTRPAVYEEAIAWGVAFFLLAMNHVWAWQSGETRRLTPAVLYGVAAVNARPTVVTGCVVLGLTVASLARFDERGAIRSAKSKSRVLAAATLLAVLPGLTAAGVFWLKLRTPAPTIAMNQQVQESPYWRAILQKNGNRTTGLIFAPSALVAYFRPDTLARTPDWPFFDFRVPKTMFIWVPPLQEEGAYVERSTSVTTTMPLPFVLIVIVAGWLARDGWRLFSQRRNTPSTAPPTLTAAQWTLAAGLLSSAAAMVILSITTVGITNRYLADFFAMTVVGVALGHRVVLPVLKGRPIVAATAAIVSVLLTAWSIFVTLALTIHVVFD